MGMKSQRDEKYPVTPLDDVIVRLYSNQKLHSTNHNTSFTLVIVINMITCVRLVFTKTLVSLDLTQNVTRKKFSGRIQSSLLTSHKAKLSLAL